MNKNAIGYVRVSSEEQVNNYSLSNQTDKCKEYCESSGYSLLKVFRDEGKSATNLNRPALIELLDYCKQNKGRVDAVIIYKVDRMSRSTYDYLEVKRRLATFGVSIISISDPPNDSPVGEFVETLMAAQARLDNAIKAERTKDGMTKRLEAGLPTNPIPVGYKYQRLEEGKNYPVRDEPKFSQLQQAGQEYISGIFTKEQLASSLNKKGFTTKNGKPASSQFISKFLANEFYKGVIYSRVRNKYYSGSFEKMFTEEEWLKIQHISQKTSFTALPHKRNNPDFPLRHFTLCAKCGNPITGNWSKGRKSRYAYYRCLNHSPSLPVEKVEEEFVTLLESIKPSEETLELFTGILKTKYDSKYKQLTSGVDSLNKELETLQEQRKLLVRKNLDGIYDDDLFKEQDEDLKNQILVKRMQINEGSMEKLDIDTICNFAKSFINNLSQTWRNADLDTKQRLQEIIFPKGVVYNYPGFTTATLSCLFEVLGDSDMSENHLGWCTGVEPAKTASTGQRLSRLAHTTKI
ncbi:MAG: Site-specific recombinase [Candidatus Collierbacteria bacterium GW2011_GWE2_42_48]|nr:MAG: Site-specific recombinase [Candidatus Collierbacteria bacterium GW2011_GWE2_42_48]